jgi:Na+-translocating ferredoxin:NAD+ oxidoreductase RNF subunit RnfB
MIEFVAPILTLTGLGLFFGLVLTWASKKFAVTQDPKIKQLLEKLPGVNCGVCGKAGCAAFAEGLARGEVVLSNCKSCSQEQASEIANILGVEVALAEKQVVTLRCHGGRSAKDKFIYQGIKDCLACARTLGGHKLCKYACLGFADCQRVCPVNAVKMNSEGLPIIDSGLCTGCGKCVAVCPRNLLVLIPVKGEVYIGCSSHLPPKEVMRVCSLGCIACRRCEKACPEDAVKVVENLAVIDYDKCTSCGKCIEACPRKIIFRRK